MLRLVAAALAFALTGFALISAGTAQAKGPFRAEVSGGDLASPITIDGPLPVELVFANDAIEAAPPETFEPAYTVKLMPEQPDAKTGEYPVLMTLTYFPGNGNTPALLRGDWGNGDRYFEASLEFQTALDNAIGAATEGDDDGVSAVWYIAPSLAAGLVLVGGLAGRKLLARRNE